MIMTATTRRDGFVRQRKSIMLYAYNDRHTQILHRTIENYFNGSYITSLLSSLMTDERESCAFGRYRTVIIL